MATSASREKTPREFWQLAFNPDADGTPTHIRVPEARYLGVFFVGMAADLHGLDGCCTCCVRRSAETTGDAA